MPSFQPVSKLEVDDKVEAHISRISWTTANPRYFHLRGVIMVLAVLLGQILLLAVAYQAGAQAVQGTDLGSVLSPKLRQEVIILSKNPDFDQPSSPKVDEAWDTLLPSHDGLVTLGHPQTFNRPPGLTSADGRQRYGITWTHQYHCLNMVRKEFWKLLRNESTMVGMEQSLESHDQETLYHQVHCFDYLRQTLMCSADMTIEYAAVNRETGKSRGFINGWDIPHVCKKQKDVLDFMTEHAG